LDESWRAGSRDPGTQRFPDRSGGSYARPNQKVATLGSVNVFISIAEEQAMAAAREAEATVMVGGAMGPLHGMPFSLKDLLATAGIRTTMGSFIHEASFQTLTR